VLSGRNAFLRCVLLFPVAEQDQMDADLFIFLSSCYWMNKIQIILNILIFLFTTVFRITWALPALPA